MAGCGDKNIDSPKASFFIKLYPAFKDADADVLEWEIGNAKEELCFESLCPVWDKAIYLYVAHSMSISELASKAEGSQQGQVIKHHVDDVDTTFAKVESRVDSSADWLSITPYGKGLLHLMKKYGGIGVMNTGMVNNAQQKMFLLKGGRRVVSGIL